MTTTLIEFQKNGTLRLNDFEFYGLMGAKFYAVIENGRIQAFKSKKQAIQKGIVCEFKGLGKSDANYNCEVFTDKGTFIAKEYQGVMLA